MTTNNFGSMPSMFFYLVRIDMFLCLIKLFFVMYLLGLLIVDQLFLGLINTFDFTNNLAFSSFYQRLVCRWFITTW